MARSYDQHCGLAAGLDVVTSRWTLLIVRDLAPGPRRFTDLFDGLPGISTDLLTGRLRDLESAGAVERRRVTAPVPGSVYQLTERGRALEKVCNDLARWGMPLLPDFAETPLRVNARWALQTMAANSTGFPEAGNVHFVIDGEELTLSVDPEGARLQYGLIGEPVATVVSSSVEFFALRAAFVSGRARLPGGPTIDGDVDRLGAIMASLPLGASSAT